MSKPKHGDLRVWWIPQIPGTPFHVPVANVVEAKLVFDTLATYDAFQFKHRIKPDYANAGGLDFFDAQDDTDGPDGSWCEWEDDDGCGIGVFELEYLRSLDTLPRCCYDEELT